MYFVSIVRLFTQKHLSAISLYPREFIDYRNIINIKVMSKKFQKNKSVSHNTNANSTNSNARKGAITEIGTLNYGDNNNLQEFKRKLGIYALRQFKDLGHMIELEEYYVPPEIPDPDEDAFDEHHDPHGALRAIYIERMKMREKAIYEMERNRTSLYSVI